MYCCCGPMIDPGRTIRIQPIISCVLGQVRSGIGQLRYEVVIGIDCGNLCSEAIVLHDVTPNDRTGPPKARLAMNSNPPGSFFALRQKLSQDVVRWIRTVHKIEFHVLDPVVTELATVIRRLVQPHNQSDVALLEIGDIVFRSQRIVPP